MADDESRAERERQLNRRAAVALTDLSVRQVMGRATDSATRGAASWLDRQWQAVGRYFVEKLRYCPGALFLYFLYKCKHPVLRRELLRLKFHNLALKFRVFRLQVGYMLLNRRIGKLEKIVKARGRRIAKARALLVHGAISPNV